MILWETTSNFLKPLNLHFQTPTYLMSWQNSQVFEQPSQNSRL